MNILQICPPNLSNVNTLPREIQKSFSTVLFIHSSVYMLRKNTALRDESVELVLGRNKVYGGKDLCLICGILI